MVTKKDDEEATAVYINPATAFVSAMEVLQASRRIALDQKNPAALVDVANAWIEMGSQLLIAQTELVYGDDDDVEVISTSADKGSPIGFFRTEEDDETKPSSDTD